MHAMEPASAARGYRFVQVDASADSRPVLQRLASLRSLALRPSPGAPRAPNEADGGSLTTRTKARGRVRELVEESFGWIRPGLPAPLGATPDESGTNFAVASQIAEQVLLCLFDADGTETRVPLPQRNDGVWHGMVPGIGAGQRYGYRVAGPYDPARGLRCNPAKLLIDPYAKAIDGQLAWGDALLGYRPGDPDGRSELDSAASVPRSLVADPQFGWGTDRRPGTPYRDTVIYELHVKGFTQTRRDVPEALRGTYAGLACPPVLDYLAGLGVTAVELLPVHQSVTRGLAGSGLTNYWGYDTIGFFAPHDGYSASVRAGRPGGQIAEFQAMVKALHAAGLEVLLDVVFNHTAEGGHLGPTLCFRGLDNQAYYRLVPGDPRRYVDTTGTGNSVNADDPACLRMITDSLRYWLTEMHVDGFRFDLAATLAREHGEFDRLAAFFGIIAQDPVISQAKLIAEPWDVGQPDSYEVGRFPAPWSEWNGPYRDTVRDFWRGRDATLPDFATRIAGSADLYGTAGRRPGASINFVTAHDGFTLRDLVSYDRKHNDANGEANRDGTDDNRSWNCGVEGPTEDPEILALRARQSRALLGTLLLSRGVPMLLSGDELGRTQGGNNNAYCQDNPTSWLDWDTADASLTAYTRRIIAFRRAHPVLRRDRYLADPAYVIWFTPAGRPMTVADWESPGRRSVAIYLDGSVVPDLDAQGRIMLDDHILILVNGSPAPVIFTIPEVAANCSWNAEVDSYELGPGHWPATRTGAGQPLAVGPRSFMLLLARRR
jgi:isoamylase